MRTLLGSRQNARKNTIKLLDRQILADITICAGPQSCVHFLFVVAHSRKNDDGNLRIDFANEGNKRNSIYFWHPKIDNHNFAIIVSEPGGCLESFGQSLAGMTFLAQVSD